MKKLDGPFIAPRSGNAKQLVIFLHGYGSNGDDLISIGDEWKQALPDAAFVSPNAPEVCEVHPAGFQWFPISSAIEHEALTRDKMAAKVTPMLNAYIDEQLTKWGVDDAHLAVAGFSQGAMMAMYAMPRRAKPCAAVIGFSGMLLDADGLKGPNIVKVPILAVHGSADDVVPAWNLEHIEEAAGAAGFEVETLLRPDLPHSIDHFSIMRALQFVQENFEKAELTSKIMSKVKP